MTFLAKPNAAEPVPSLRKISIVIGSKASTSSPSLSPLTSPQKGHSNLATQEENDTDQEDENDNIKAYDAGIDDDDEEDSSSNGSSLSSSPSSPSTVLNNPHISQEKDKEKDKDREKDTYTDVDKETENKKTNKLLNTEETNSSGSGSGGGLIREWKGGKRIEHIKGSRSLDFVRTTVGVSRQTQTPFLSLPLSTNSSPAVGLGNTPIFTPPPSPSSTPTTPSSSNRGDFASQWASSLKPSETTPRKSDPSCHRMPESARSQEDRDKELDGKKFGVRSAGKRLSQGVAGTVRIRYQLKTGRNVEIDKNNDERCHSDTEADDKPPPRSVIFDSVLNSKILPNSGPAPNASATVFTHMSPLSSPRNEKKPKASHLTRIFNTLKPSKTHDRSLKTEKVLPQFGISLRELVDNQVLRSYPGDVPLLLSLSIPIIRAKGLTQEGIFRVSASYAAMDLVKADFEQGNFTSLESVESIHTIAGLIEKFLQELPEPLLTYDLFDSFLKVLEEQTPYLRLELLRTQLSNLPLLNLNTLKLVLGILNDVHNHAETNKMSASNLGLVFGPILMNPREIERMDILTLKKQSNVVSLLVEAYPTLFETF